MKFKTMFSDYRLKYGVHRVIDGVARVEPIEIGEMVALFKSKKGLQAFLKKQTLDDGTCPVVVNEIEGA